MLLRRAVAALVAAALAALLSDCAGASSHDSLAASIVNIGESDFQITGPDHLKAGKVLLRVSNSGPDQHELIVARVSTPRLPLRSDGLTVEEEALAHQEPGVLEPGQPGAVRGLSVDLAPGRYVLFCNMEGHYLGGMHHEIVVGR